MANKLKLKDFTNQRKHGLAVEAKFFNNFPIYDKKVLPLDFVMYDHTKCMNYMFLMVKPKELDQFENNSFTMNFSKKNKKNDENDNISQE